MGRAMVNHYQGDDRDLKLLLGALAEGAAGVAVDAYADQVAAFFEEAQHPKLGRPYRDCGFAPMVELLRHWPPTPITFIVSGGDRDFMRPAAEVIYSIPRRGRLGLRDRLRRRRGRLQLHAGVLRRRPAEAAAHLGANGRRPAIACGNSNGDLEMLRFAGGEGKPALRLVVARDDAEREVDDRGGADEVLGADDAVRRRQCRTDAREARPGPAARRRRARSSGRCATCCAARGQTRRLCTSMARSRTR